MADFIPDDLKDSSQVDTDKDYFKVTILDLDLAKEYDLQFRWQYETNNYGDWSAIVKATTDDSIVPPVTNIITEWKGTTLYINFDRPTTLVDGQEVRSIKEFELSLTANSYTPQPWNLVCDYSKTTQTFVLTEEQARQIWRDPTNEKLFPTSYSGLIRTVTVDNLRNNGVSFFTSTFSDPISGAAINPNSWRLAAGLDGYTVSIDPFSDVTAAELYDYSLVFESIETSPNVYSSYQFVTAGVSPINVVYYSDLRKRRVQIQHKTKRAVLNTSYVNSKSGYSLLSDVKTIGSVDPGGYDDDAPSNDGNITAGIPSIDGDGLFDFNYKVPFSWPAELDSTVLGYRIRWRPVGPEPTNTPLGGGEYTHTIVPGRLTTTTYLYGVLAGQRYEVGKNTYDEYGNTDTGIWKTTYVTVPAFTGEMGSGKVLKAGDMKLGYGVGPGNEVLNKGLYLSPNNYWYVFGNTVIDNNARIRIGSSTSYIQWNGTDLTTTGIINALGGDFTGTINVGSPTVSGQLRVVQEFYPDGTSPKKGVELGKFNTAITEGDSTMSHGIYIYDKGAGNYILLNATDASIRANNVYLNGVFQTQNYGSTGLTSGGIAIVDSSGGDVILFSKGTGTGSGTLASIVGLTSGDNPGLVLNSGTGTIALTSAGISLQSPNQSVQAFISSTGLSVYNKAQNVADTSSTANVFRNITTTITEGYPTGSLDSGAYNGDIVLVREQ